MTLDEINKIKEFKTLMDRAKPGTSIPKAVEELSSSMSLRGINPSLNKILDRHRDGLPFVYFTSTKLQKMRCDGGYKQFKMSADEFDALIEETIRSEQTPFDRAGAIKDIDEWLAGIKELMVSVLDNEMSGKKNANP